MIMLRRPDRRMLVRIAGSGMVLSGSNDTKVIITEAILQGIGLSPLLFEVSLVMLRRSVPSINPYISIL